MFIAYSVLHVSAFHKTVVWLYEKAEVCSTLWAVKDIVWNIVVIGRVTVHLSIRHSGIFHPYISVDCTTGEKGNRNFEVWGNESDKMCWQDQIGVE